MGTSGHVSTVSVVEYGKAARAAGRKQDVEVMPSAGRTAPVALIHRRRAIMHVAGWLRRLESDRFVAPLVLVRCF